MTAGAGHFAQLPVSFTHPPARLVLLVDDFAKMAVRLSDLSVYTSNVAVVIAHLALHLGKVRAI